MLGLLQLEGFASAHLLGDEIQVTAHGAPLIIRACGGGYEIYSASGDGVTSICDNAREVLAEIRGRRWRR